MAMPEHTKVLPHEKQLLYDLLQEGIALNRQAAIDMRDAVDDPNVYHDNASYDAVIDQMKKIDDRYTPIARLFNSICVVEYPSPDDTAVSLGSLVKLLLEGEPTQVLVVGQLSTGRDVYHREWDSDETHANEELLVVTPRSQIGVAILGSVATEAVAYVAGDARRKVSVEIESIDQTWIRRFETAVTELGGA